MEKELQVFFEKLLGLEEPWYISEVEQKEQVVHIYIDFKRGAKFNYKGEPCKVHDTVIRQWRHMNLLQYKTYLHAYVPRIYTPDGVKQVKVPWARAGSGFTLLFEASVLSLAQTTSVAQIHRLCGESETRLWRVLKRYKEKEASFQDLSQEPAVRSP